MKSWCLVLSVFLLIGMSAKVGAVIITVPNGDFEQVYKPGTAIPGVVSYAGWTQGVGPDCPIDSGAYIFDDGTTGDKADIPGWIGYDRDAWIASGGTYGRDQTTGNLQGSVAAQGPLNGAHCFLGNGSNWGNPAGALIVSDASLATVDSALIYTLSVMTTGGVTPVVLELLADGVALTPSSSVSPPDAGGWRELSRTYDATSLSGHDGESLTILLGHGRPATGTQNRYDDVSLTYVPEPATIALLGLGALALVRPKRR